MPAPIDKITLKNFKAFYGDEEVIELGGKHLLLYGENGSGKSTIYWALYTLLQSATKSTKDIQKYFEPSNDEHLINFNFIDEVSFINEDTGLKEAPLSIGLNAFIEIELTDGKKIRIDSRGIRANENEKEALENLNKWSDFISHRLLINFYNFRNSKFINLWEVFVRDIFPFLMNDSGNGTKTLSQVLKKIETEKPYKLDTTNKTFKVTKSVAWQNKYNGLINYFNDDIVYWLGELNRKISHFYNTYFKSSDNEEFQITLEYQNKLKFSKHRAHYYENEEIEYERWSNLADLNSPSIRLIVKSKNGDGTFTEIKKPQSHLNEAKLTSIGLAVRFSLLDDSIRIDDEGKILALDDLLVSLDMSNREKVLNVLLDEYASKYKIYLFTHEKSYYDFCVYKIQQRKKKQDWNFKAIHSGETSKVNPVIISSGLNYYEKAKKYYLARDYTTCSLYLRKELEKLIIDRIPDEFSKTVDNQYHNLEHYWKLFVERFEKLNLPVSESIKINFKQSKLMILNPEAHHNLESPVYKLELANAFSLVEELFKNYPVPKMNILFSKGMLLVFTHPTKNYSFEFQLLTDFSTNILGAKSHISVSRCKIIKWQFDNNDYWDFPKEKVIDYNPEKPIIQKLDKIIYRHTNQLPLDITDEMFIDNLELKNSIWSFKEILNKVGVKYENDAFG